MTTHSAAAAGAAGRGGISMSLDDDTQRKGPCGRVKDHSARGLGDGPTPAHVEPDQSGNVVEAILLELEQLPGVALAHRRRHTRNIASRATSGTVQLKLKNLFLVTDARKVDVVARSLVEVRADSLQST